MSTLEISPSALYLLAEIKTPTSARDEAIDRATVGETITLRVAKEIVSRHKKQDPHLSENLALPIVEMPNMLNEPAILGLQTEFLKTVSPQFCVGDRIRILRRQEGEDKWTGCTAKVWEVTQNGWLRVNIEGHQGVKFTLNPDWVEIVEELDMTESTNPQIGSETYPVIPEKPLHVRIPIEIEGTTIEIDGIINEVEVHYTHQGISGTVRLPVNSVAFAKI